VPPPTGQASIGRTVHVCLPMHEKIPASATRRFAEGSRASRAMPARSSVALLGDPAEAEAVEVLKHAGADDLDAHAAPSITAA
jgi:hypothetical protein